MGQLDNAAEGGRTGQRYEAQVRLAEKIASIVPIRGGVQSFFGNSGTEAIEACIKLARYATGRPNIIAFLGGFHGRTIGSLSLTASKAIQRRGFGPLMPGVSTTRPIRTAIAVRSA